MQGALPASTGRSLGGNNLLARYGLYAGAVIAALVGLLVLPAVFHGLGPHDVQIADKVSLLDVIWIVLAVALSVFLAGTRGAMLTQITSVLRARLEDLQRGREASDSRNDPSNAPRSGSDLPAAGATTVARLFDIIFLLVIQAIIREPLVGVVKAWVSEPTIDGAYVVLVVLIALVLLINVRTVSRPVLDYLLWLGLDSAVPTAGFGTSNASETFTRITGTGTATRTSSGQRSRSAGQTATPSTHATEPTIAAPGALEPTILEGSVEATVAAPRESEEVTVVEAAEATVVQAPQVADATVIARDAGETIIAGPNGTGEDRVTPKGRSEGER
ncbi:MAG TPA: hypothetical protein VFZ25_01720 [Chloroflexota bacterium]|nr:hypothetical protein [Chloroflexota bacterium]